MEIIVLGLNSHVSIVIERFDSRALFPLSRSHYCIVYLTRAFVILVVISVMGISNMEIDL